MNNHRDNQNEYKKEFFDYVLIFFGFSIGLFRVIYAVNLFVNHKNVQGVHLVNIFEDSRLFFFCTFFFLINLLIFSSFLSHQF